MRKISRILFAIAQSSLLWGCLAAIGFYTLIFHDIIPYSEHLRRYTSREWAEVIETTFFFVGAAELLLKGFEVAEQRSRLHRAWLLGGPAKLPRRQPSRSSRSARSTRRAAGARKTGLLSAPAARDSGNHLAHFQRRST